MARLVVLLRRKLTRRNRSAEFARVAFLWRLFNGSGQVRPEEKENLCACSRVLHGSFVRRWEKRRTSRTAAVESLQCSLVPRSRVPLQSLVLQRRCTRGIPRGMCRFNLAPPPFTNLQWKYKAQIRAESWALKENAVLGLRFFSNKSPTVGGVFVAGQLLIRNKMVFNALCSVWKRWKRGLSPFWFRTVSWFMKKCHAAVFPPVCRAICRAKYIFSRPVVFPLQASVERRRFLRKFCICKLAPGLRHSKKSRRPGLNSFVGVFEECNAVRAAKVKHKQWCMTVKIVRVVLVILRVVCCSSQPRSCFPVVFFGKLWSLMLLKWTKLKKSVFWSLRSHESTPCGLRLLAKHHKIEDWDNTITSHTNTTLWYWLGHRWLGPARAKGSQISFGGNCLKCLYGGIIGILAGQHRFLAMHKLSHSQEDKQSLWKALQARLRNVKNLFSVWCAGWILCVCLSVYVGVGVCARVPVCTCMNTPVVFEANDVELRLLCGFCSAVAPHDLVPGSLCNSQFQDGSVWFHAAPVIVLSTTLPICEQNASFCRCYAKVGQGKSRPCATMGKMLGGESLAVDARNCTSPQEYGKLLSASRKARRT